MDNLPLFILLAFLAEVLGTIGGFGSSMLFVPVAAYFLDFYSVLGITAIFHVSSNLSKIALFRKGYDKKLVMTIGIPAVLFVIAGAWLSKVINVKALEAGLAVFLITMSLLLLFFRNYAIKPTAVNAVAGGTISGFVAGIIGTGGAIRGITLAAFHLPMERFIATSAIIDLAIDFSRSIVYAYNGYVHQEDLYLIPVLLAVSIAGTFTGKKVLKFVSEEQFRSIVLLLVLVTGVITLFKVLSNQLA